jgi:hypothetical protein
VQRMVMGVEAGGNYGLVSLAIDAAGNVLAGGHDNLVAFALSGATGEQHWSMWSSDNSGLAGVTAPPAITGNGLVFLGTRTNGAFVAAASADATPEPVGKVTVDMDGTDITVTITPQALSDWFACDFSVTLFKVVHTAKVKVGATVVDPSNTSNLRTGWGAQWLAVFEDAVVFDFTGELMADVTRSCAGGATSGTVTGSTYVTGPIPSTSPYDPYDPYLDPDDYSFPWIAIVIAGSSLTVVGLVLILIVRRNRLRRRTLQYGYIVPPTYAQQTPYQASQSQGAPPPPQGPPLSAAPPL